MEKIVALIVNNLDSIITGGITIVGFIVTYHMTRKNLRDELIRSEQEATNDKLKDLLLKVCQMMNKINEKEKKTTISVKKLHDIMSGNLAYGSKDAIKIAIHMQRLAYSFTN